MPDFVVGAIFGTIKSDTRVTLDLETCLYCIVSSDNDGYTKDTGYDIPLTSIDNPTIKQCPSCKRIYILSDPTK